MMITVLYRYTELKQIVNNNEMAQVLISRLVQAMNLRCHYSTNRTEQNRLFRNITFRNKTIVQHFYMQT